MCVFCAAVPATLSMGVAVDGQEREKRKVAEAHGETPRRPALPVRKVTSLVVAGLVVAAVINHAHPVI
jgi:hypothetical protein